MPIYLGNHKLKELYLGSHKIKEAYLGSTKIYSAAVAPTYEIWSNDSSLHLSSNGASSTAWSLNAPSSTNYQYVLLQYNVYVKILQNSSYGWCGIDMYISNPDYSRSISFQFTGNNSSFSFAYIYALTSIFTGWNNASGITTNTVGTETDYASNTYRYVQNSTYFDGHGDTKLYTLKYIFDQVNKKLYFYFGNNKIYLGYADLSLNSSDIINKMNIYSSQYSGYMASTEIGVKNIICGGFSTLQAAIDY